MTPTVAEQRQQFEEWFHSPGHQAYMAAVAAGGGIPLDDPEKAFELYRLRWTQAEGPAAVSVYQFATLIIAAAEAAVFAVALWPRNKPTEEIRA